MAQPPGIVYSTTIPYSGTVSPLLGFAPNPGVSEVVTDLSGNTYVAGSVLSNGLPSTPGVVQPGWAAATCDFGLGYQAPCADAFIAKFDSKGALVFLTYLGGTGNDVPYGLAVDASGSIYIGGQTTSTDFPLAGNPWRSTSANPGTFVTKLSADGSRLIWSTVLDGNLLQLAMAPDLSIYYLAQTTVEAPMGASVTAALTKLTLDGQFVSTASVPSQAQALAIGADGSVYIGGRTDGSDVKPTPGAWQPTYNGGVDSFAAKMNPTLSGFAWLTFVGGNGTNPQATDNLNLMQPAPDGTLWIAGTTYDPDFPVLAGALETQRTPSGTNFLVHLSADGSKALAATYFAAYQLTSLGLDGAGNVLLSAFYNVGYDLGHQATPGAQWPCQQPADGAFIYVGFFGKIDSAGQHLLWGTFTGPSIPIGPAIVDAHGNLIAAGNVPGQGDITLTAMTTVPGPPRLVDTCIDQSVFPNLPGPLAPGELVSIYGAGFGPQQGVGAQPSGNKFGTELGGLQVLIENVPVPLLYVSAAQINLIAPYLLDGRVAAHIKIVTESGASNEVVLGVRPSAPEIFLNATVPSNERPTAAIINPDGTVNSQDNPAHVGDTVAMFVSGVGQTVPPGVDGEIPQTAGGTPVLPVTVQLDYSYLADVIYAGNAPGLVSGIAQVNFQVPPIRFFDGPPYSAPIVLFVGGATSGVNGPAVWFE